VDPDKMLEAVTALIEGLRADMTKLNEKCDAVADAMKKKADGDDDDLAQQTAADSSRVTRREFEATQAQLRALQTAQPRRRSDSDRNNFAEVQARADVAYRALGERADAPMQGEELIDYGIRLHRPLQKTFAKMGQGRTRHTGA
jgi:hypothetical protein